MDPLERHPELLRGHIGDDNYLNFSFNDFAAAVLTGGATAIGSNINNQKAKAAAAELRAETQARKDQMTASLDADISNGLAARDQKKWADSNAALTDASNIIEDSKSIIGRYAKVAGMMLPRPVALSVDFDSNSVIKFSPLLGSNSLDSGVAPPNRFDTKAQNTIAWIIADNNKHIAEDKAAADAADKAAYDKRMAEESARTTAGQAVEKAGQANEKSAVQQQKVVELQAVSQQQKSKDNLKMAAAIGVIGLASIITFFHFRQ